MLNSSSAVASVAIARRPRPPHLLSAEIFRPNILRELKQEAKRRGPLPKDDLEDMMEQMLQKSTLPSLPRKGLFGLVRDKLGRYSSVGASENLSCSERVNRQRCRTVLQLYALLDPLNAGYVDPETACSCIASIKKESDELADILLHVMEDMIAFVSSRGVIEKHVFLKTLHEWIQVDNSGIGPYYTLRLPTNPVSLAYRKGLPCTNIADRDFYRGTYAPQGLERKLCMLDEGKTSCIAGRKAEHSEPAPNSGQHIRATVAGDLEAHIRETEIRREMKISALREKLSRKEMEECTFKPETKPMPSFSPPFPKRRDFMEQSKESNDEIRSHELSGRIVRQTVPVDSEIATPPDDSQADVGKKRGSGKSGSGEVNKTDAEKTNTASGKEEGGKSGADKRERSLPALPSPKEYDFWVFHHGIPETHAMEFHESLRTSALPAVPLDGLSPDSPKLPRRRGRSPKGRESCRVGASGSHSGPFPLGAPYTIQDMDDVFPNRVQQGKSFHKPRPPLTPGLPKTFKLGFVRERLRESSEERRIRLGQAKATQPPPEAAAEMRRLKKNLLAPSAWGSDPLLWETDARNFTAGLTRSPKRPPLGYHGAPPF